VKHSEIKEELKRIEHSVSDIERLTEQLKQENAMSSTSKTQKECNDFMIKRFEHNTMVYMKRKEYMLLLLERPEEEQPNLYNELTNPSSSLRHTPRAFLVG